MTPRIDLGSPQRWRLRTSRLWILAGALGIAAIASAVSVVHDTAQRRQSITIVLRSIGAEVSATARERLELLALGAARCRCGHALPGSEFFTFDVGTGAVQAGAQAAGGHVAPALLAELARTEAARPERGRNAGPSIHVLTEPRLGDRALVSLTDRDASGRGVTVSGLVSRARDVAALLFRQDSFPAIAADSMSRFARLDSMSLLVSSAQGVPLFGAIYPERSLRATVHPRGPLDGLTIDIALSHGQLAESLLALPQHSRLWVNGLLILSTVLVISLAIGSSRREVLLARTRSDFVAGVSHDLRMPLAQILIAGETLTMRRERDETERLALSSSIVREARRLISLVENVLLFSRSGAVELRPRLDAVPVRDVFGEVVDAVHLAVDDARQTIEICDAPANAGVTVLGDRRLVRQALVNLVDNALKYGKPGQTIHLAAEQHSREWVRLSVTDEGDGVPRAERDRVFEPYERLEHDQTSERTGTGLGLAVVRHIAHACGGKAWLEDGPDGRGTRVVLELRSAASDRA